ncbi:recombinase family protein [Rhodovulum sp. YNF3179]|uniref:recombinase family protein n=1 Tax=Rhodovulum sp. YNF3179 TaxID=3425127 RepID=UPI003D3575C0
MHQSTRAILYARCSSDLQSPASIEDQLRKCRAFAKDKGWQVVAEHTDRETSGSVRARPGFQALLEDMRNGACDVVVAESLDRISRDQEHTAAFYKDARFHDVEIYSTAHGKVSGITLAFGSAMASHQLEDLAGKTRRGLEGRVVAGKSGGGLSYGYRVKPVENGVVLKGEIEIDEEQAAIVQRIFREYVDGRSPMNIAADLNAEEIPSPRGRGAGSGHWKQNTINGNRSRGTGILNNELYVGRRVWNRHRYVKNPVTDRRVARLNDPSEWVVSEVPHLRIIDQELWDAVKARQEKAQKVRSAVTATDRNGLSSSRMLRRRHYPLSGLLECELCGGRMTIAGSGKYKAYYCANAKEKGSSVCKGQPGLNERLAAETVVSCMKDGLMTEEAYEEFRGRVEEHLRSSQGEAEEALRLHDKQVRKLEKNRANLLNAIEEGQYSASVIERLNAVDAELKELRGQRDALVPQAVELPDDLPERYRAFVDDLLNTLSDERIAARASDELQDMLDRIVVSWDDAAGAHLLDIRGDLVEMLKRAKPAEGAGFDANACSLELVAGRGFEPLTFRL